MRTRPGKRQGKHPMNRKKTSILRWLDEHLEETLLILLLLALTFLTGAQVLMRRVFANPLIWSEELCRYCFMWSGFIGIAYCIRKRCDIRISTFAVLFPERIQKILLILTHLVSLAVFGVFFRVSINIVIKTLSSAQTSPAVGIPFYVVYFCTVLGFGLALVRLAQVLIVDVRDLLTGVSGPPNEATFADK